MEKNKELPYILGVGCVSKNVIDSTIELYNEGYKGLALIASNSQISQADRESYAWKGNCVDFNIYVRERSNILLCRDHGYCPYPTLGSKGRMENDALAFDIIHLDPFKYDRELNPPGMYLRRMARYTRETMVNLLELNPKLKFEIGTEKAVHPYTSEQMYDFLRNDGFYEEPWVNYKSDYLIFIVSQTSTGLNLYDEGKYRNLAGPLNRHNLEGYLNVAKKFNLYTKEHNADFLGELELSERSDAGIDSFNIAPEFGMLETQYWIDKSVNEFRMDKIEKFLSIILKDGNYRKWMNPITNIADKWGIIKVGGHYTFNTSEFKEIFRPTEEDTENIKNIIKDSIIRKYNAIR